MMFFFGPIFGLLPFIFIILLVRGVIAMGRGSRGYFPWQEYEQHLEDLGGSGGRERELRIQIFKLAYRRKGRITVSDIIAETGLTGDEAEELIQGMVDNTRVRMEILDSGVVVYEFPEIISRFEE
ncbi:MAG: hypothetical protein ACLFPW_11715 [Spirochaetaceae bacterium]